jgi:oxygen-independent coproporphyrinogen-3 oxidase
VGLGVSAIGKIGDCYSQNLKEIPRWSASLAQGELPIWRGVSLTAEDQLRREIIESIMCHGELDFTSIGNSYGLDFADYFAAEIHQLEGQANDGLLEIDEDSIHVLPAGRLLLRSVAMVFDHYLQGGEARKPLFSRVI